MLKRIQSKARALRRGPLPVDPVALRLNFSLVLHEHSASTAVADHVAQAIDHARLVARLDSGRIAALPLVGADDLAAIDPAVVLTASIGVPGVLARLAPRLPRQPHLIVTDRDGGDLAACQFFRAEARLALPKAEIQRLAVAAALLRPGGTSVEIVARGPYGWPDEEAAALQSLEDIVRDYLPQWHPPRALWPAPAEELLPEFRADPLPGRNDRL